MPQGDFKKRTQLDYPCLERIGGAERGWVFASEQTSLLFHVEVSMQQGNDMGGRAWPAASLLHNDPDRWKTSLGEGTMVVEGKVNRGHHLHVVF